MELAKMQQQLERLARAQEATELRFTAWQHPQDAGEELKSVISAEIGAQRQEVAARLQDVTDLSLEVQHSLRGLREIGNYAGTVQRVTADMADTRGAVEQMMDLLEKTLTIKDGNALLNDQEALFDEKLHQSQARVQAVDEDLSTLHSKVEAVAADLMNVVNEVRRHGEADGLKVTEKINSVEDQMQIGMRSSDERFEALKKLHDRREKEWAAALADIKRDFDARLTQQATTHSSQLEKLRMATEAQSKRHAEALDGVAGDHARDSESAKLSMEAQVAKLERAVQDLDSRASTRANEVERQLVAGLGEVDKAAATSHGHAENFSVKLREIESLVQINDARINSTEDGLTKLVNSKLEKLKEEVDRQLNADKNSAANELQSYKGELTTEWRGLRQDLTTLSVEFKQRLDAQAMQSEKLGSRIKTTASELDKAIQSVQERTEKSTADTRSLNTDVENKIRAIADQVKQQLEVAANQMDITCRKVESAITKRVENQNQVIDSQHVAEQARLDQFETSLCERQDKMKSDLGAQVSTQTGKLLDLGRRVEELQNRVDSDAKNLEEQTVKRLADHDNLFDAHKRGMEQLKKSTADQLQNRCRELDANVSRCQETAAEMSRTAGIELQVATSAINKKLIDVETDRAEKTQALEDQLRSTLAAVHVVKATLKDLDESNVAKHNQLSADLSSLSTNFSNAETDKVAQFDALQAIHEGLEAKIVTEAENLRSAMHGEVNGVAKTVNQVADGLTDAHKETAMLRESLNQSIVAQRALCAEVSESLEKALVAKNEEQDKEAERRSRIVKESVDTLQAALVQYRADADLQFADLHAEAHSELMDKTVQLEKTAAQAAARLADHVKKCADDTQKTRNLLDSGFQELTTKMSTVEKQHFTKLTELESVELPKLQIAAERTDTILADHIKKTEESVEITRSSAESATKEVEAQLVAMDKLHRAKIHELASVTIVKFKEDAAAQIRKLEAQIAQANDKQTARCDSIAKNADASLKAALKTYTPSSEIAAMSKQQDALLRDLDQRFQTKQDEVDKTFESIRSNAAHKFADVNGKLNKQSEEMAKSCDQLDAKFLLQINEQSKHVENQKVHFAELLATAEAKFTNRANALKAQNDSLGITVRANEEELKESCNRVDERCKEFNTAQTARTEKLHRDVQEDRMRLESKMSAELVSTSRASDERIDAVQTEFLKRCTDLSAEVTGNLRKHDTQLNDLAGIFQKNHHQLSSKCDALDNKAELAISTLHTLVSDNQKNLIKEVGGIRADFEAKNQVNSAEFKTLTDAIADGLTNVSNLLSETEARLIQQDSLQDERLNRQQSHFGDLVAKTEQKFQQQMDAKDAELKQFGETATLHHTQFVDTLGQLEKKIADNASQWKKDATQFSALCTELKRDFLAEQTSTEARVQQVKDRMQQIDHDWLEASSQLDRKFASQTENLDHQFQLEAKRQEDRLNTLDHGFDQKIKAEHDLFLSKCDMLEKETSIIKVASDKTTEHLTKIIEANRAHVKTSHDEITHKVETYRKNLSDMNKILDEKIDLKFQQVDDRAGNIHKHFDEVCLNLEFRLTEKNLQQDQRQDALADTQQQHFAELAGSCTDISAKLEADTASQRAMIGQQHAHFTKVCTDTDSAVSTRLQALKAHVTDVVQSLSTTLTAQQHALGDKMEQEFSSRDDESQQQFGRLDSAVSQLNSKVDQNVAEMRATVVSTVDRITAISDSLHQKIGERQTSIESEFRKKNEEQDIRLQKVEASAVACHNELSLLNEFTSKLGDRVNVNYSHFNSMCNELSERIGETTDAINSRLDHIEKTVDTNHADVLALFDDMNRSSSSQFDSLNKHRVAVDRTVEDHYRQTSEFCASLDKTAQEQHTHFTEIYTALDTKLTLHASAVEKDLGDEHEHFTTLCAELEKTVSEESKSTNVRFSALQDVLSDNFRQCTQNCESIENMLSKKNQQFTNDLATLRDALNDRSSKLEAHTAKLGQDLTKESHERSTESKQQRENFTAELAKLGKQFSDKTKLLSSRINELTSMATQKIQGLSQANSSLDQQLITNVARIDAVLKELAVVAEQNRGQLAIRCENLETGLTETKTNLLSRAKTDRQHLSERCDVLHTNLLQRTGAESFWKTGTSDLASQLEEARNQFERLFEAAKVNIETKHQDHSTQITALNDGLQEGVKQFTSMNKDLQEKTTLELAALTERIAIHSKHFAATVANEKQEFAEKHATMITRVAQVETRSADIQKKAEDRFELQQSKINDERDSQVQRLEDTKAALQEMSAAVVRTLQVQLDEHSSELASQKTERQAAAAKVRGTFERLDRTITEQKHHVAGKYEKLRTELVAMHTDLDVRCTDGLKERNDRLDKLSDHVDSNIQRLLAAYGSLQNQFVEERAAQTDRAENNVQYFNDTCSNIESKLSENIKQKETALRDVIEQERERVTDALSSLSNKNSNEQTSLASRIDDISNALVPLQAQFDAKFSELNQQFSLSLAQQEEQLMEHQKRSTEACAEIDEKYHTIATSHDTQFGELTARTSRLEMGQETTTQEVMHLRERHDAQDARLDGLRRTLDQHHNDFTDACAMLDTKIRDAANISAAHMERVQKELIQTCADVDKKCVAACGEQQDSLEGHHIHFTSLCSDINANIERRSKALDKRAAETMAIIDENAKRCSGEIEQVDKKLADKTAIQDGRMRDQNKHFGAMCASIDEKTTKAMKQQQQEWANEITVVNQKIVDWTEEADARIKDTTAVLSDHHRHFSTICTKLDVQLKEQAEAFASQIATDHAQTNSSIGEVDKRITELTSASAQRCDELDQSLEQQKSSFASECLQLQTTLNERVLLLNTQIAQEHAQFTELCEAMDNKLLEQMKLHSDRMDSCATTVHEHHRYFTSICEQLDAKYSEAATAQRQEQQNSVTKHEAALQGLESSLSKLIDEQGKTLDSRLDSSHKQFSQVLLEQDTKFTDACVSLDAKVVKQLREVNLRADDDREKCVQLSATTSQALGEELKRMDVKFTDVCIGIDQKTAKEGADLRHQLATDIERLQLAFSEDGAKVQSKMAADLQALDEKMTDSVIGLDQKAATLHDESSERLEQLQRNFGERSQALHQQLNTATQDLDRTLTAQIQAADEAQQRRADELGRALVATHQELSSAHSNLKQQLESSAARVDADLSSMETKTAQDTARELGVIAERTGQRFDAIEKRLDQATNFATLETQRLDRESAEQQQRLASTCDRLNTTVSDLSGDLDRLSKSATRHTENLALELQNKTALLDAELSALTSDSKQGRKKLRDDIDDNKKRLTGQLDALSQDTKMNIGDKLEQLLTRFESLEASSRDAQKLGTTVQLLKMDLSEVRGFSKFIEAAEDKIEQLGNDCEKRFSELEVDVQILQATSQAS